MIERIEISGLNGMIDVKQNLFEDINIITGRNGCGKTTLLKLIWYSTSGNLERVFDEVTIDNARIITEEYTLEIDRRSKGNTDLISANVNLDGGIGFDDIPLGRLREHGSSPWDKINRAISRASQRGSVFFPTFRRIEGGFSIGGSVGRRGARLRRGHYVDESFWPDADPLAYGMQQLSENLSVQNHKFVSSISTSDIGRLLNERYAAISTETNKKHQEFATSILKSIGEDGVSSESSAAYMLNYIAKQADAIQKSQRQSLQPFTILSDLVIELFQSKGIEITDTISLGQAANSIHSSLLSAGEKQMLSFLCYNAFMSSVPVFIDEPEISLHVDWQRRLFAILLDQNPANQFIIATHSPFIFSKFADREIVLSSDRGL